MNNFIIKALSISVLNLLFFLGIFTLLQRDNIYSNTLGLISKNYEITGNYGNYSTTQVEKPYLEITDLKLEQWDADIYKCIKDRGYSAGDGCYEKVRTAFFPLFPYTWRFLQLGTRGICIFNYLLFAGSLAILIKYLFNGNEQDKLLAYLFSLTLPSAIIYYIPYSESLFLFTMSLAIVGLLRKKYWLFFTGILLLAMTRPATVFLLAAFLFIITIRFIYWKNFKYFLQEIIQIILPFLTGYILVLFTQFGIPFSTEHIFDAQKFWPGGWQLPLKFSDWSVEGFGISSFSMIVLCIPAVICTFYYALNRKQNDGLKFENIFNQDSAIQKEYLFRVSAAYLAGMLIYILFYKGGSMQSFFRYTISTPMFYIMLYLSYKKLQEVTFNMRLLAFVFPITLLCIFLGLVEYGGSRLNFQFAGLYLFVAYYAYFLFQRYLNSTLRYTFLAILFFAGTIWNTYLLNMFLSDAWLFT